MTRPKTPRRRPYTGALAQRGLPPHGSFPFALPEEWDRAKAEERDRAWAEYVERGLALLFKHYGIHILERHWSLRTGRSLDPKDRYVLLALELAKNHVPYFQPLAGGMKPDTVNGLKLALAVAQEKRNRAKSDLEAIRRLRAAGKFKGQHPDHLRKKLARARKDPVVRYYLRVAEIMPKYRSGHAYATLIRHARLGQNL